MSKKIFFRPNTPVFYPPKPHLADATDFHRYAQTVRFIPIICLMPYHAIELSGQSASFLKEIPSSLRFWCCQLINQ